MILVLAGSCIATSSAFVVHTVSTRTGASMKINEARVLRAGSNPSGAENAGNENESSSSSSSKLQDKCKNADSDLLERARKLREEASLLEDNLRATKPKMSPSASQVAADIQQLVVNKKLENSVWTLSYRFSSQPPPKDDGKNNNNDDDSNKPTTFYSGKINLLLKDDGYSEQIVPKDGGTQNNNNVEITKIWGWDRETSNEDDLDYLLFSMDVEFPESDPDAPNKKDRYYLQARIEDEGSATGVALKDGTITVKKDVTEKTGGMWGLFNVAGILTEFRYCGNFAARPAAR